MTLLTDGTVGTVGAGKAAEELGFTLSHLNKG